jgi:hypothetical protein
VLRRLPILALAFGAALLISCSDSSKPRVVVAPPTTQSRAQFHAPDLSVFGRWLTAAHARDVVKWEAAAVRPQPVETLGQSGGARTVAPVTEPAAATSGLWHTDGYDWQALARCETGADWRMHGSVYSTAFGIMNGAGEMTAAALAGTASPDDQVRIAIAVERRAGIRAWGCHAAAGG